MRKILGLLLLPFLLASWPAQRATSSQKPLALTHVTVIDATGGPLKPDFTVVINGNRITGIGDAKSIHVPQGSDVVDATGKFLIPGLWDIHVHWYIKDYLPLFIANGVTGIRQMWGNADHHAWRDQIEKGTLLGPHMVIASPIVDGPKPLWPGSIAVASESEARQTVIQVKKQGADFVKVYSFLPREEYFAIADEAKKQGIPFAGHVPFGVSVEEASDAGQKSIEHLIGIPDSCSTHADQLHKLTREDLAEMIASGNPSLAGGPHVAASGLSVLDSYSPENCAAVFARFKKNGTWVCPTLATFRIMAMAADPSLLNDARLKYMPRQVRASWDPKTNYIFKMAAMSPAYAKEQYQYDLRLVAALDRAGVGIIAGTDTLNPFTFPGFSLHDELASYVQAGLTPMAALQTATRNPARFLGREKDFGTVEIGKVADLVLLDANPLEDIRNTTKIAGVVFAGKFFPKGSVQDMLAKAEALASTKSIADALLKTIQDKGADAAIQQYHELKTSQSAEYDFGEEELNGLGYQLIAMKRIKAIQILKLNVEAYPMSSNAYDSLGEVYMDNGDKELATSAYKKSLELDPSNTNAAEMLKKLNAP